MTARASARAVVASTRGAGDHVVDGRAHADRDLALVRDVELAREEQRRIRRPFRFLTR